MGSREMFTEKEKRRTKAPKVKLKAYEKRFNKYFLAFSRMSFNKRMNNKKKSKSFINLFPLHVFLEKV
jgi:hypothetical protein